MRLLLMLRYLLLVLLCFSGVGMLLHAQPVNKSRIAVLGDSIAYAGRWANEVENALKADKKFAACEIVNFSVPSETVAGLSEYGHAGGRFPRPCLHERLDRVLRMYRPQLILACYGMNDGLMQAFDKARFQAYQEGNIRLKAAADAAKAAVVFITPPLFRGDSAEQAEYDAVLDKYAE
jgi:lysophospholipase L1-like esterase